MQASVKPINLCGYDCPTIRTSTLAGVGYEMALLMFSSSPSQYIFGPTALNSALSRRSCLPSRVTKEVGTVRERLDGPVMVRGSVGKVAQLYDQYHNIRQVERVPGGIRLR